MPEKPTVLVFTTAYAPFVGGAEIAIAEVAKRLRDDFDFVIITARLRRALKKKEVLPEGTVIRVGLGTRFDKLLLPFLGFFVGLRLMRGCKTRPRILLWGVMVSYASIAAFFIKVFKKKIPFVLTIQEGNREWERALPSLWWRIVPRAADHVITISNFLKDEVRKKGYQGPVSVVPNGVDERLLNVISMTAQPREILRQPMSTSGDAERVLSDVGAQNFSGLGGNKKIIFSASRLVYKNGIDLLLEAAARLQDSFDFKILLAGEGPERTKLQALAEHLHIADRVEFLGSVPYEQLPELYKRADIFVRPSRSEGLGSAFLEAMAAGVITVGTSVGGIPDFLADGTTGFVARPEDVESLRSAISRTFSLDEKNCAEIIDRARLLVREKFLWSNVAVRMKEIFFSIL